jgi:hypothetical protein
MTEYAQNPNIMLSQAAEVGDIGAMRAALADGATEFSLAYKAAAVSGQRLALSYLFDRQPPTSEILDTLFSRVLGTYHDNGKFSDVLYFLSERLRHMETEEISPEDKEATLTEWFSACVNNRLYKNAFSLLQSGANPTQEQLDLLLHQTIFHRYTSHAEMERDAAIAHLLLDLEANPNTSHEGRDLLSGALGVCNLRAAEVLLARGADPNKPEVCGNLWVELHLASGCDFYLPCVQILLSGGARPDAKTQYSGKTVLELTEDTAREEQDANIYEAAELMRAVLR